MAAVGSVVSRLKRSILNNAIHYPVYLVVSNITTPLPLSCLKITMVLLLDRLSMTFLYLYGTLILLHFSLVFLSLGLTHCPVYVLTYCPVYVLRFSISLGKNVRILPQ